MRIVLALGLCLSVLACGADTPSDDPTPPAPAAGVDRSTPETLAESIFRAARTGVFDGLDAIVAPGADGDTKSIASLASAPAEAQAEFRTYFEKAKVVGEARIDGDKAEVDFVFGPEGTKQDTFEMVKIDGQWALFGF